MCFKLDRASLIVGSKFTIFSLFYVVFEGNFPSTSPWGSYIWRGDLTEGFLHYQFGGLIFGVAYTWMGLFLEFYGMLRVFLLPSAGDFLPDSSPSPKVLSFFFLCQQFLHPVW